MPRSCSYGTCKNNQYNTTCRFFQFPNGCRDPDRRRLWAIRCGRKTASGDVWEPKPDVTGVYVCSDHFISGEPWNNKTHPDYAPTLDNSEQKTSASSVQALRRFLSSLMRCGGDKIPKKQLCSLAEQPANSVITIVCGNESVETSTATDEMSDRAIMVISGPPLEPTVNLNNCGSTRPKVTESLSFDELKASARDLCVGRFLFVEYNSKITFVQLSNAINSYVEICVVIDENLRLCLHVLGKPLMQQILMKFPQTIYSLSICREVLDLLSKMKVCSGITDDKLCRYATVHTAECVRSETCCLLLQTGNVCLQCRLFRRRLLMRKIREKSKGAVNCDFTKSKRRNSFMSSPMKYAKLRQLAEKRRCLLKETNSLKARLASFEQKALLLIEDQGETLPDSDNAVMLQLVKECKDASVQSVDPQPFDDFQRIFLEQQIKYNELKTKSSMRWHPAVIRWCLFIRSKSARAYDGMRAYLNLPSNRTLYDYTHYTEHGIGIKPKNVEQLIEKAKKLGCFDVEHKSFVGILHDEIKIKADLVYHKTTGELIGYTNLDEVSNSILNVGNADTKASILAEYILVAMVRGITTGLRYPLAAYATKSLSASILYSAMWECVECLEIIGLRVLYICCDAAVQNRKFFSLHGLDNELTHKTRNPYSCDSRDIFFVSDPPHLLKTARNCFANSDAHSKSRSLWFNQSISWKSVIQMYEEHCENGEFRLCPKLTRDHLTLTSYSKMRVKLAAQVFSATVANGLQYIYGNRVSSTVEFIRIMNRWFDLMNVKNLFEGQNTRNPDLAAFTDRNDLRLTWLEKDFQEYFDSWKAAVESRPGIFTQKDRLRMQLSYQTINGLKMTSLSVAAIVRKVLDSGAPFVLTCHLNQDPLEQLFGHCRHKGGSNDNPSVGEACHAINAIRTVNTQAVSAAHGNTAASRKELDCSAVPKRSAKKKLILSTQ